MFSFTNALSLTFTCFSLAQSALGHGYVQEITLGSTKYTGYLPYQDPYMNPSPQRIVRRIPGNGPVENLALADVQCNGYAAGGFTTAPAPLVATVAAGSTVRLNWTTWPDSHVGPAITYMARAPSDIRSWNPGNAAVWFKVHEAGKTADGRWAATHILYQNNHIYSFTIPASLRPGQYLIRHELYVSSLAFSYPGVQVYPVCIQVQVTGSGNSLPTSNLVSFPGAYTASTPGIVFNVYGNNAPYPIPGPPV
ncbi:hypothetical protein AX16_006345 [Volvariella volvacea WC 439]|nr:hypothetical protein AX16_006345 [Volvariella volvacea WC 439]